MQFIPSFTVLAVALFPILGIVSGNAGDTIPDNYIIVLKDGITQEKFEEHQHWAQSKFQSRLSHRDDTSLGGIHHGFQFGGLYGYTGSFDNATLEEIRQSEDVDIVEEDKVVVAYDLMIQSNPPSWGLGRLSDRTGRSSNIYLFDRVAGKGVNVYVLDTGVNVRHSDFGGRAVWGANLADHINTDAQGHGTHVAGTIAGANFGVAKRANIIAVKVLGDNGASSTSKLIAGIEWTLAHSRSNGRSPEKSVVNLSLGGSYSNAVNRAVRAATSQGLTFVVAAGNDGRNAAYYSPASEPSAITVGATQRGDIRASYSNYGNVVDVFAPGSQIVSTWKGSNFATHTLSGTSMASPHVAGLAAYLISVEGLSGAQQVTSRIKQLAQHGFVKNPGFGSPNSFAWNGAPLIS
ncbi:peptidase S8/S53 domain-containing protein [Kalaharituber pfeilii]|nr:peptidase S8/S53 domain-containing protein [Kalaharituber pfeilii]